jgi:hypothetical protein
MTRHIRNIPVRGGATMHRFTALPVHRTSRVHRGEPDSDTLGAWMFSEDETPETDRASDDKKCPHGFFGGLNAAPAPAPMPEDDDDSGTTPSAPSPPGGSS